MSLWSKFSGHYFTSTDVPRSALTVHGANHLTWFRTGKVQRGFCSTCGSSLFWDPLEKDWTGIAMGAFDPPTGTRLRIHIHVADRAITTILTTTCPKISIRGVSLLSLPYLGCCQPWFSWANSLFGELIVKLSQERPHLLSG